jgi:hypothetical protein
MGGVFTESGQPGNHNERSAAVPLKLQLFRKRFSAGKAFSEEL